MRNNWMKRILTAACIMALLTGCGAKTPADTQQPGEEPAPETPAEETKPDMTLGQVMEANKIENLLKNHSAVKIKTELYEQEGDETPGQLHSEQLYHGERLFAVLPGVYRP